MAISTYNALHAEILRHEAKCRTDKTGLTSLAGESQREALRKGPLVELLLEVEDVSRGHAPYHPDRGFTLTGTLRNEIEPSWLDKLLSVPTQKGHSVVVFFDGTTEERRLGSLRQGEMVGVAGYVTIGLPTVFYEDDFNKLLRPFGVSEGRFV